MYLILTAYSAPVTCIQSPSAVNFQVTHPPTPRMCLNSQSEPIGVHALIRSPHLKWALVERRSGWLSLGSVRLARYLPTRWFWAGRRGRRITASPLFLSSLISRSIHCPMLILFASAAVWEWSSYKRGPVRLACSWHKDTVVNSPLEISQTVCSKVEPDSAVASFFRSVHWLSC